MKKDVRKEQKGFTLIELVIVITIIAILGTAGVFGVTNYVERSKASTDIANAGLITNAIQRAIADNKLITGTALNGAWRANADGTAGSARLSGGTVTYDNIIADGYLNGTVPDVKGWPSSNTNRGWRVAVSPVGVVSVAATSDTTATASTTNTQAILPKPGVGYQLAPYSLVN